MGRVGAGAGRSPTAAVHAPSSQYGSGQQCCYTETGLQLLTTDSIGGSTPDRGHDWGAPPYRVPPRVPGLSHWLYDVISFYYCCLWAPECSRYMQRRPSSDCRSYRPPRLGGCTWVWSRAGLGTGNSPDPPLSPASAFGDPHFITFDGTNFTFNGRGEYVLLEAGLTNLRVQARAQTRMTLEGEAGRWGSGWLRVFPRRRRLGLSGPHSAPTIPGSQDRGTGLTAVAIQEGNSDVVEVRLAGGFLQVLLNQEVLSFAEQSWMDLKGEWDGGPSPPCPPCPAPISLSGPGRRQNTGGGGRGLPVRA